MPVLDERKARILRAVVEEYVHTAQPVGSGHVARSPEVNVSSATIRNEMAALEQDGYLRQPHTSAGRVPTDKGYRYFVDHLDAPARLDASSAQQVRSFFNRAHGELEQMLHDTSRLLSTLTGQAAVVVGPAVERATIRSIQLVGLGPRVALVVMVLSNGVVEKHTLELDTDVDDARLGAATTRLARDLVGHSHADVPEVAPTGEVGTDAVISAATAVLAAPGAADDPVFVDGASRVATEFDAVETVAEVLRILEEQFVVVTLLRDVLDRGLQVAIGVETGMQPLAECSLVVAPYEVAGEPAGTIGVLGPTRMDYPQALAAVAVVSKRLGRRLSDG